MFESYGKKPALKFIQMNNGDAILSGLGLPLVSMATNGLPLDLPWEYNIVCQRKEVLRSDK